MNQILYTCFYNYLIIRYFVTIYIYIYIIAIEILGLFDQITLINCHVQILNIYCMYLLSGFNRRTYSFKTLYSKLFCSGIFFKLQDDHSNIATSDHLP